MVPESFPEPTQRCIKAAREKGVEVFTTIFDTEVPTAQVMTQLSFFSSHNA